MYNSPMRSPADPTLFRPGDILARSGAQAFRQPLFDDGRNEVYLLCDAPASASGRGPAAPDEPASHAKGTRPLLCALILTSGVQE